MDALFLDHLLAELRPQLLQRHLGRPREAGRHGLVFELPRSRRLLWDAARETAGLYLLERDAERALRAEAGEPAAASRRAALLARKHLEGARVDALERVPGTRVVVMRTGRGALALRPGGPAPAFTLVVDGAAVATVGEGPPAWPLPEADPARDIAALDAVSVEAEVDALAARGWPAARALLAACPALGPVLARAVATGVLELRALASRAAAPVPTVVTARPLEECADVDFVGRDAVQAWPFTPPPGKGVATPFPSWAAAASAALVARVRGLHFDGRRRQAAEQAHVRASRLARLEVHLAEDLKGLPAPDVLRHRAEALLAAGRAEGLHTGTVRVPDPYDAGRVLEVAVDPRLGLPQNADRLFDKARRAERAARRVEERLRQVRDDHAAARRDEEAVAGARNASDLPEPAAPPPGRERERAAGPRVYLTSRGLSLLVGRGARENQQLTFSTARPDDWWLHARDVPGAHVVVRDPEGRADEADRREAAEVAAFFSGHRMEAQVDVHVTRRRNVRPGGAPGRVRVLQSETLRVHPRDPDGRLRRR